MSVPEAAGGINATEAADGVPVLVTLPAGAVAGDVITVSIDGSTPVSYTVTAADVAAPATPISVLLPATDITAAGQGPATITTTYADAAGNAAAPVTTAVSIDTTAPAAPTVVQFVGATKNGAGGFNKAIDEGDVMTFSVTMSEDVTVTGNPTLSVNIGGVQRLATFDSVSGNVMTFKYTVVDTDFDHNGVQIDANKLALAGGTIKDLDGNAATLTHAAVGADTNSRVDTIDLGGTNGLLIRGAQADGNWYFAWDRNGDGTHNDSGGYSTMTALNGQTINGVSMTLPEFGMAAFSTGLKPSTAVSGGGDNPTYDGLLAIWDAYNGSEVGATGVAGVPTGWSRYCWSATPSPSGHARVDLYVGSVYNYSNTSFSLAAYQVL